jgi:ATP phosphoribosyltransferase regulatory subunit
VTFAVHVPELPGAVLRGGRYDNIGKAFGRARPAVGFSIYLRELVGLLGSEAPRAILAPSVDDAGLHDLIGRLRRDGEIVVQRMPDEVGAAEPGDFIFDRELRQSDAGWQLAARDIVTLAKQEP